MKCIIPCAGYGTRMGMQPHESKEMIIETPGTMFVTEKKIIDYSLNLCKIYGMEPLVISRRAKKDLNNYLETKNVQVHNIVPKGEWYNSVLKSKNFWHEDNVLLLPDTRFGPFTVFDNIQMGLELGNKAVFAVHKVSDPQNWGVINNYEILDKPKCFMETQQMAWGIIGFKKSYGVELFSDMEVKKYLTNVGFVKLTYFEDITRGVSIVT